MYRNDAITLIHEVSGLNISESRKYLDRVIDMHKPEFDKLRTNLMPLSGTKSSHFRSIILKYHTDGQHLPS
jgi:tryptophan 2,3-dioxygenase